MCTSFLRTVNEIIRILGKAKFPLCCLCIEVMAKREWMHGEARARSTIYRDESERHAGLLTLCCGGQWGARSFVISDRVAVTAVWIALPLSHPHYILCSSQHIKYVTGIWPQLLWLVQSEVAIFRYIPVIKVKMFKMPDKHCLVPYFQRASSVTQTFLREDPGPSLVCPGEGPDYQMMPDATFTMLPLRFGLCLL